MLEDNAKTKAAAQAAALDLYVSSSRDLEIDENADVSIGDTGAWVQAWVYVPNAAIKRELDNGYE